MRINLNYNTPSYFTMKVDSCNGDTRTCDSAKHAIALARSMNRRLGRFGAYAACMRTSEAFIMLDLDWRL